MYVKLYSHMLDSSIWLESPETRVVFVTLLLAKDRNGFARFAAPANLANRARVSLEACEEAIRSLEAPDPSSSDDSYEGRRIERVPGGWLVLNADKYRDLQLDDNYRQKAAERMKRYRERLKNGNATVTPSSVTVTPPLRNVTYPLPHTDTDTNTDLVSKELGNSKALVATELVSAAEPAATSAGAVNRIFAYWQTISGHSKARLTAKRKRRITDRLREGYTEEELQAAIAGNKADAFHQGDNDRGTVFDDIELICRDGEHVEKFTAIQEANSNGAIIGRIGKRKESRGERIDRETREYFEALSTDPIDTAKQIVPRVLGPGNGGGH